MLGHANIIFYKFKYLKNGRLVSPKRTVLIYFYGRYKLFFIFFFLSSFSSIVNYTRTRGVDHHCDGGNLLQIGILSLIVLEEFEIDLVCSVIYIRELVCTWVLFLWILLKFILAKRISGTNKVYYKKY